MSLLHGKQISGTSISLGKLDGTGFIEFTLATMSFANGAVLTTEDSNIVNGTDVVNKNYVDSSVSINVENGIEIVSNFAGLGGTFSRNTTLNGAGFDLIISNVDYILFTSSVFDIEANGLISLDAGTGSVQVLADNGIVISGLGSVDLVTNGDLNFTFDEGNVIDNSGNGLGLVYAQDYSGTFVTNSLVSKLYIDSAINNLNYFAGDGLQLNGLTFSIDPSSAGTGLTYASGVFNINLGIDSGLTFSGNELVINVENGIEIVSNFAGLGGTFSRNTTLNGAGFDLIIGDVDYILFTSSVFDIEANGLISLDAGIGSVQVLADDSITISASSSVDLITNGDLNLSFYNSDITDNSGNGYGLQYTSDYSGTFVTNSLITKKYVDDLVNAIPDGDITAVLAGTGLTGGATAGTASLSIDFEAITGQGLTQAGGVISVDESDLDYTTIADNLAGNGLTSSGSNLDIDFEAITGTGLTQNGSQISIDYTDVAETLAGNGLTSSGSVIDVQVDSSGLNIDGQNRVALNNTITGDRTFSGSITIQGDITVNGTASYINTTELLVEDNYITLNSGLTSGSGIDAGIEVLRGSGTAASILWNESFDLWAVGLSGSESFIITEAGTGLVKNGNELSLDFDNSIGAGLTANSGVINVQVDNGLSIDGNNNVVFGGTLSNNTILNLSTYDLTIDGTGDMFVNIGNISMTAGTGDITMSSQDFDVTFNTTGLITDGSLNGYGLQYTSDYSGTFVTNSLVTKAYVDLIVGSAGTITEITAGDGLIGGGTAGSVTINVNTGAGITISSDAVAIDLATNSGLNTTSGLAIDSSIAGAGLTFSAGILSIYGLSSSFGLTVDGAGSTITTGNKGYLVVPYDGTITGWTLIADQSGSCVIDVWKESIGNIPTIANTITGTEKPTLTSQQINSDLTLTSWTTNVLFGDIIGFNVDSVSTITRFHLTIYITKQ
jgi:hypothetical protein